MRNGFGLFILLLVLGAGGCYLTSQAVNTQRDQVTIKENVLWGDAAVVEDLTVECRTHYSDYMFWETLYKPGSEVQVATEFTFSAVPVREQAPTDYEGVHLENVQEYGLDLNLQEDEHTGLDLAYYELFQETEPGEEKSKTIRLRDYQEYYPIGGYVEVPMLTMGLGGRLAYHYAEWTPEMEALVEYFKIPVLEEETRDISITRHRDGNLHGLGGGSTESDAFQLWTIGDVTEDACYFVFDAHTTKGNIVDLSEIKGGYGIYRLPYVNVNEKETKLLVENLEMVYELDPDVRIADLKLSEDKTRLLFTTMEQDTIVLTVIKVETMECLQRLEVAKGGNWGCYYGEGFIVWRLDEDHVGLISEMADGTYQKEFIVSLWKDVARPYTLYLSDCAMDWNGEKLVISGYQHDDWSGYYNCNFYLAVYDSTGMLYCGDYDSSLTQPADGNTYNLKCRPNNYDPLAVSWEDL